ncbi:MAG: peptide-methionine (S)-S-oxide reductase MsrA [bacterium]|nr:peptide-methionine (S)-S-oxide reductase MsrA [bacterium]
MSEKHHDAVFAMGCFWEPDALFSKIPGVLETAVGYTGGTKENPTYEDVCGGATGHAEAVQIIYDPKKISYDELLDIFWKNHNPTTPGRQGPDIGAQYRSVIFFHTPEQEAAARASKEKLEKNGKWGDPIVTEIVPAGTFWRAEEYHQKYFAKKGIDPTCHV